MDESGATRSRGATPMMLRVLLGAGFVVAVGATGLVVLADNVQLLRLAAVLALWAALIAAFAVTRSRRDAKTANMRVSEAHLSYQVELQREVSARHEFEAGLAAQMAAEQSQQIAELREQLDRLTDVLSSLADGELLVSRMTLSAQSARFRKNQASLADPTAFALESSWPHQLTFDERPVFGPEPAPRPAQVVQGGGDLETAMDGTPPVDLAVASVPDADLVPAPSATVAPGPEDVRETAPESVPSPAAQREDAHVPESERERGQEPAAEAPQQTAREAKPESESSQGTVPEPEPESPRETLSESEPEPEPGSESVVAPTAPRRWFQPEPVHVPDQEPEPVDVPEPEPVHRPVAEAQLTPRPRPDPGMGVAAWARPIPAREPAAAPAPTAVHLAEQPTAPRRSRHAAPDADDESQPGTAGAEFTAREGGLRESAGAVIPGSPAASGPMPAASDAEESRPSASVDDLLAAYGLTSVPRRRRRE